MQGLTVEFFPPQMSNKSLLFLAKVAKKLIAKRAPRLSEWLIAVALDEAKRRDTSAVTESNSATEPGNPVIDVHRWSNDEIADGLRASYLLSTWTDNLHLGEFADSLLKVFCVSAESRLRSPES